MGALKNKNIVAKKLIEIFEVSREHIAEMVINSNSDYAKLLAGEDVTINDNIWVSSIYTAGTCTKKYETITINVFAGDDNEVATNFTRVIVVYNGLYEAYFRKEEWEMVLNNLRCIIDRAV